MSVKYNTAAKKILPLKMLQLSVLTPFFWSHTQTSSTELALVRSLWKLMEPYLIHKKTNNCNFRHMLEYFCLHHTIFFTSRAR